MFSSFHEEVFANQVFRDFSVLYYKRQYLKLLWAKSSCLMSLSETYSRSLPRAQMGNGVHFVFFIDFVLLKGAESKTIKSCAQTRPQAHPQILHRKKNKFSKHLEVWYQWKENLILTKKHVKTMPSNWFLLKIWLILDFDVSWNILF